MRMPNACLRVFATALIAFVEVFLICGRSHAAENRVPSHRVDGTYVREWLLLGPFPSEDLQTDFLIEAGGEATIRPKEGDVLTTKDGKQLKWQRFQSSDD